MQAQPPGWYGEVFADVYDAWYGEVSDVDATVTTVIRQADGGTIVELGVGTGRLAIPLAASGATIIGVDASVEMIERLVAKPDASGVVAVLGDMSCLPLCDRSVELVFAAYNTFFNLVSLTAQMSCFAEAARILRPGGRFVVEAFVPPEEGMPERGATVREVEPDAVTVVTTLHDPRGQIVSGEHVVVEPGRVTRRPWVIRYASPTQLDEMASASGLVLESRTETWSGEPFTPSSGTHVSTYRRPFQATVNGS